MENTCSDDGMRSASLARHVHPAQTSESLSQSGFVGPNAYASQLRSTASAAESVNYGGLCDGLDGGGGSSSRNGGSKAGGGAGAGSHRRRFSWASAKLAVGLSSSSSSTTTHAMAASPSSALGASPQGGPRDLWEEAAISSGDWRAHDQPETETARAGGGGGQGGAGWRGEVVGKEGSREVKDTKASWRASSWRASHKARAFFEKVRRSAPSSSSPSLSDLPLSSAINLAPFPAPSSPSPTSLAALPPLSPSPTSCEATRPFNARSPGALPHAAAMPSAAAEHAAAPAGEARGLSPLQRRLAALGVLGGAGGAAAGNRQEGAGGAREAGEPVPALEGGRLASAFPDTDLFSSEREEDVEERRSGARYGRAAGFGKLAWKSPRLGGASWRGPGISSGPRSGELASRDGGAAGNPEGADPVRSGRRVVLRSKSLKRIEVSVLPDLALAHAARPVTPPPQWLLHGALRWGKDGGGNPQEVGEVRRHEAGKKVSVDLAIDVREDRGEMEEEVERRGARGEELDETGGAPGSFVHFARSQSAEAGSGPPLHLVMRNTGRAVAGGALSPGVLDSAAPALVSAAESQSPTSPLWSPLASPLPPLPSQRGYGHHHSQCIVIPPLSPISPTLDSEIGGASMFHQQHQPLEQQQQQQQQPQQVPSSRALVRRATWHADVLDADEAGKQGRGMHMSAAMGGVGHGHGAMRRKAAMVMPRVGSSNEGVGSGEESMAFWTPPGLTSPGGPPRTPDSARGGSGAIRTGNLRLLPPRPPPSPPPSSGAMGGSPFMWRGGGTATTPPSSKSVSGVWNVVNDNVSFGNAAEEELDVPTIAMPMVRMVNASSSSSSPSTTSHSAKGEPVASPTVCSTGSSSRRTARSPGSVVEPGRQSHQPHKARGCNQVDAGFTQPAHLSHAPPCPPATGDSVTVRSPGDLTPPLKGALGDSWAASAAAGAEAKVGATSGSVTLLVQQPPGQQQQQQQQQQKQTLASPRTPPLSQQQRQQQHLLAPPVPRQRSGGGGRALVRTTSPATLVRLDSLEERLKLVAEAERVERKMLEEHGVQVGRSGGQGASEWAFRAPSGSRRMVRAGSLPIHRRQGSLESWSHLMAPSGSDGRPGGGGKRALVRPTSLRAIGSDGVARAPVPAADSEAGLVGLSPGAEQRAEGRHLVHRTKSCGVAALSSAAAAAAATLMAAAVAREAGSGTGNGSNGMDSRVGGGGSGSGKLYPYEVPRRTHSQKLFVDGLRLSVQPSATWVDCEPSPIGPPPSTSVPVGGAGIAPALGPVNLQRHALRFSVSEGSSVFDGPEVAARGSWQRVDGGSMGLGEQKQQETRARAEAQAGGESTLAAGDAAPTAAVQLQPRSRRMLKRHSSASVVELTDFQLADGGDGFGGCGLLDSSHAAWEGRGGRAVGGRGVWAQEQWPMCALSDLVSPGRIAQCALGGTGSDRHLARVKSGGEMNELRYPLASASPAVPSSVPLAPPHQGQGTGGGPDGEGSVHGTPAGATNLDPNTTNATARPKKWRPISPIFWQGERASKVGTSVARNYTHS